MLLAAVGPTQAIFYTGEEFPDLEGNFIFGEFNTARLIMLVLDERTSDRVLMEKIVIQDNLPIIGVTQGPDGSLWYSTVSSINRVVAP